MIQLKPLKPLLFTTWLAALASAADAIPVPTTTDGMDGMAMKCQSAHTDSGLDHAIQ